jgi:NAD(P)-dependent dehydrogenase (short-subunit alcohol dehydrogenase family)
MNQKLTPEKLRELGAAAPMGRLVTPDEVAETLAFLASEDSGFTTGHYFPLDGGLTMD